MIFRMSTLFNLEMSGVDVQKIDLMHRDALIQRERYKTGYALARLGLPKKDSSIQRPLDDWCLARMGYVY